MQHITFGDNRHALQFGDQKINLHQSDQPFLPNAKNATTGTADLCLITSSQLDEVICELRSHNIEIIEGPVKRSGAKGEIKSVYIRDPDDNLLELSNYII